jgi:hypothetical protein
VAERHLGLGALSDDRIDLGRATAREQVRKLRFRLAEPSRRLIARCAFGKIVERKQSRTGRNPIAAGDVELHQCAADRARDQHVVGLDIAAERRRATCPTEVNGRY